MLEDSYQQTPIATWNSVRGVWETNDQNLFCAHLGLFSETWPTSGTMRNGQVFELQMQVHHTTGLESLSLPIPEESILRTPSVTDSTGGAISETQARERGRMVKVADQVAELAFDNGLPVSKSIEASLLPTPAVAHLRNHDEPIEDYLERRAKAEAGEYKGMPGVSLGVAVRMEMLPTPTARDFRDGQAEHKRNGVIQTDTVARAVFNSGEVSETNWGKFEPAIRRWERITRPAPLPTKPDGKDGAHRLSSEFTEWMMGLPAGWVTGVGLKRKIGRAHV